MWTSKRTRRRLARAVDSVAYLAFITFVTIAVFVCVDVLEAVLRVTHLYILDIFIVAALVVLLADISINSVVDKDSTLTVYWLVDFLAVWSLLLDAPTLLGNRCVWAVGCGLCFVCAKAHSVLEICPYLLRTLLVDVFTTVCITPSPSPLDSVDAVLHTDYDGTTDLFTGFLSTGRRLMRSMKVRAQGAQPCSVNTLPQPPFPVRACVCPALAPTGGHETLG